MAHDWIAVRGARVHNLRNIDVDLPRDRLVVITGLSGSGKSSLAFDTIYAEGQRRYVESLSAYARQFLEQMEKPDVDLIDGLSPAISIEQKTTASNPRSTVGTVTEIYDYLRLLFANIGVPHCPNCDREITSQSLERIMDMVMLYPPDERINVLAPVVRGRKGEFKKELAALRERGFTRARIDGQFVALDDEIALDRRRNHTIDVLVDRLIVKPGIERRLSDSIELALKLADDIVVINTLDGGDRLFSRRLACPACGISIPEMTPRAFSFNSPHGACPDVPGPGRGLRLRSGARRARRRRCRCARAPWRRGRTATTARSTEMLAGLQRTFGIDPAVPFAQAAEEAARHRAVRRARARTTAGQERRAARIRSAPISKAPSRTCAADSKTGTWTDQEALEPLSRAAALPGCRRRSAEPESRAVRVKGRRLAEYVEPAACRSRCRVFETLELTGARAPDRRPRAPGDSRPAAVPRRRRRRLSDARPRRRDAVGRRRAAHPARDADRLAADGRAVRARRAVHRPAPARQPPAARDARQAAQSRQHRARRRARRRDDSHGGLPGRSRSRRRRARRPRDVSGPAAATAARPGESLTGQYLRGERRIDVPAARRPPNEGAIVVRGARANNLKHIDVAFPLGTFIAVTGVSGSGKSTLVNEILYRSLARDALSRDRRAGRARRRSKASTLVDKVIQIDQSPIGRTPRSNPATYTGLFTFIRELFAMLPEARARGYKAGRFSFNVKGGRCETCQGDGVIAIEMHFLPNVYVTCEECKGRRYNRETLEIKYRGKSIAEMLELTVDQALPLVENFPPIAWKLRTLQDVGLGYIKLGQSATTLSGGEAQRVKLARELARRGHGPHALHPR